MARGGNLEKYSPWRFFPLYLMLALGVVIAVNIVFITVAEKTFPGETGDDDPYDIGNNYNSVLNDVARQRALGWKIAASQADGRVIVTARAADGSVLPATVSAVASHPLGALQITDLRFVQVADGSFQAQQTLGPGRWDVRTTINLGGNMYRVTEHLLVK